MLLVNTPVPVPLLVLVGSAVVGLGSVFHTTPRAVIVAPPSLVMVPPLLAALVEIPEIGVVVKFASVATEIVTGVLGQMVVAL